MERNAVFAFAFFVNGKIEKIISCASFGLPENSDPMAKIYFYGEGKKYELCLDKVSSKEDVCFSLQKGATVTTNDVFSFFPVDVSLKGVLLVREEEEKEEDGELEAFSETYEEYCLFIKTLNLSDTQWIYNILDGIAEQERVLYQDEDFVLLPTCYFTFDQFHLLAIPKDKSLHSIRDLRKRHLKLLDIIVEKSYMYIMDKFNLPSKDLYVFFHYLPSTWHLHIHFTLVKNHTRAEGYNIHNFEAVRENLLLDGDYYKKIKMHFLKKT